MKYLVNLETDGDGIYHVHTLDCKHKPNSNFKNLDSENLHFAIEEAMSVVNSTNVSPCSHCI